jgi:tungstate transport system substrate-binding protein
VSRGDASGTHARERQLWDLAGVQPSAERILETGQGMAATLRVASERQGYCLTDRATFLQLAPVLRLAPVFEGGEEMLNTYAVIVADDRSPRRDVARRLVRWLTEGRGRRLIEEFAVAGTHPFVPWPAGRPADTPQAQPR